MAFEYLKSVGTDRKDLQTEARTVIGQIVKDFSEESLEIMQQTLVSETAIASGELSQSIRTEFMQDGEQLTVDFYIANYWDFVNSGVDGWKTSAGAIENQFGTTYSFAKKSKGGGTGGMTFKESIRLWVAEKGIQPKGITLDSLYFLIMRSIKEKGRKPTEFVNKAFTDERIEKLQDDVFNAFANLL